MSPSSRLAEQFQAGSHVVLASALEPATLSALSGHFRDRLHELFSGAVRHRTPALRALPEHAQHRLATLEDPLTCFEALGRACSPEALRELRRAIQRAIGNDVPTCITQAQSLHVALTDLVGARAQLNLALASVSLPAGVVARDGVSPWHQDSRCVGRLGVWVPLQAVSAQNGCFVIAPNPTGTEYPAHWADEGAGVKPLVTEPALWPQLEAEAYNCECAAGDVVVFDTMAPHATRANRSAHTRWAMVFWGGPDA